MVPARDGGANHERAPQGGPGDSLRKWRTVAPCFDDYRAEAVSERAKTKSSVLQYRCYHPHTIMPSHAQPSEDGLPDRIFLYGRNATLLQSRCMVPAKGGIQISTVTLLSELRLEPL